MINSSELVDIMKRDTNNIIIFPAYEELKSDIAKLRTELSMLATEKDELVFVECENIRMSYMLSLGALEYNAYKLECKILRLKRKIELVQTFINRQEKIDLKHIEDVLDREFAEYQEKLDQKIADMNKALARSKAEFLSEEDTAEIKKLYFRIVKALHPDLHPNQSEANMMLFHNAVNAYENGDLMALRVISEMIGNAEVLDEPDGLKQMIKEKERLVELVAIVSEQITEIKNSVPYTLKEFIKDDETIELNKKELELRISQLEETTEFYEKKISEMI